ncbi:biotin--[acetyl-CoA-carboxylase] ligase [Rickettsiales endosymbiont of Stachyamoeba lipophora]|uniref:biotin--[acetyl-CoA-carboxylase] ligase n=1 Tax=Rickettsiales endosymbiont of Stachyamoeba lipophora TaxID=2486578 RepID=UPI000F64A517|nr:biotin--[acetyl-CoA-carboxylase] ligase [Rickettsiales endosymbiont of Stachyamoeba lipophora]AZL15994.1 biotin--[acetyl-CoA-carboxylase] ligase [Rickettsiales endosymbiont of Stachyamoeba lipophora]
MNINIWHDIYNVLIFDHIDSTNNEAKRITGQGLKGNFLIWSKSQSAGRGRNNRNWVSEPGNLFFSVLLQDKFSLIQASQIVFVAAVAMGEALRSLTKLNIEYKWPNDLIINNSKVGGILVESKFSPTRKSTDWIVVGIGINIMSFPNDIDASYPITSLFNEKAIIKEDDLLSKFLDLFHEYLERWNIIGMDFIRDKWSRNAYRIGQEISIKTPNEVIKGQMLGINTNGALFISLDGLQTTISSGEIILDK